MDILLKVDDRDLMGSMLPRWYGFAYREWDLRRTVLCAIPLNLLVRYTHKVYWRIYAWLKHDGWQDKLDKAEQRGRNEVWEKVEGLAYKRGYEFGKKDGRVELQKEINDRFDTYLSLPYEKRREYLDSLDKRVNE